MVTRRWILATAALTLLVAASCAVLTMPTTTRQGINYRVTSYTIPAYVKALDFVQRHYQYRLLVSRICNPQMSDLTCTLAIFDWTHTNIPPTPAGWPVVDDHPLHVVIRGHGTADQIADVFVTLTDYAGIPAFFRFVTEPENKRTLVLSFVRVDEKWAVFDVANHVVFRRADGDVADVHDLADDAALVDGQAHAPQPEELPYSTFISRAQLMPFDVPHPLRAEMQQPWPRVRYELRRAVGLKR
jgi:hypothetical protein